MNIKCIKCGSTNEVEDDSKGYSCQYCGASYVKKEKTTEKPKAQPQQFFKLNIHAPYSAVTPNYLAILIIAIMIASMFILSGFLVMAFTIFQNSSTIEEDLILIITMFAIAAMALAMAIVFIIKYVKIKKLIKETAINGYVTFGRINNVDDFYSWLLGGGRRRVVVYYQFVNDKGEFHSRTLKTYHSIFSSVPYQIGQPIAILFYQGKSFVLKRYELMDYKTEYGYGK